MPQIHPTAVIPDESELHDSVEIGPYCVLEGAVKLGEGVVLRSHVHLAGPIEIGARTVVYPFASLGGPPQDYKVKLGDPTAGVVIGADCIIREHVTINSATNDHTPTRLGDGVFMMIGSHAGHDVQIGNKVIIVNHSVIGGHAQIGDGANLSGLVAVHQHNRIGRLAMVSGGAAMAMEVPPFCIAAARNSLSGINLVGLRRSGMDRKDITLLRKAFRKAFYPSLTKQQQIAVLEELAAESTAVGEMLEFVKTSKRSISGGPMRPPRNAPWIRAAIRGEIEIDHEIEDSEA